MFVADDPRVLDILSVNAIVICKGSSKLTHLEVKVFLGL